MSKYIVLYTSATLNRQHDFSIGIHGYSGTINDKPVSGISKHVVTNKGYLPRKVVTEETVNITPDKYLYHAHLTPNVTCEEEGELEACIKALSIGTSEHADHIVILTDSPYIWKNTAEYKKLYDEDQWSNSNGVTIPNSPKWKHLFKKWSSLLDSGVEITVSHFESIEGTIGFTQSQMAASLCTKEVGYESYDHESDIILGYWKVPVLRHPLLGFKRALFRTNEDELPGRYYCSEPYKDELNIGKKVSTTGYSVVQLIEPSSPIEMVREVSTKNKHGKSSFISCLIDHLFSPGIAFDLSKHGKRVLATPNFDSGDVTFGYTGVTVANEINPISLTYQAIDYLVRLETILDHVVNNNLDENSEPYGKQSINMFDVTSTFYDTSDKGKKTLVSSLVVGVAKHSVPVKFNGKKRSIRLNLGTDIYNRNILKRIEPLDPIVYMVTWRPTKDSGVYAIIIKTDEGFAITSNVLTNSFIKT